MELPMRYLVAMLLGAIVLVAVVGLLISTQKGSPDVVLQEKYYRGCRILATNGCNFDFKIDGEEFEKIIEKMGLTREAVEKSCCKQIP